MDKEKREDFFSGKAEDDGRLTPAEDNNDAGGKSAGSFPSFYGGVV